MKKCILYVVAVLFVICISSVFMEVSEEVEEVDTKPVVKIFNNISAFQIGAFKEQDKATSLASEYDGIITNDNEFFYVYVAILSEEDNIKSMSNILKSKGINFYLKDINPSTTFKNSLISLEKEMIKASSNVAKLQINRRILDEYEKSE